ncbi:hypothetical protein X975_26298, partial [Stegodyphus mimosarum]
MLLSDCARGVQVWKNGDTNTFMLSGCTGYDRQNIECAFKCLYCPYSTDILSSLNRHIGTYHVNPHACAICRKRFKNEDDLNRHILNHAT